MALGGGAAWALCRAPEPDEAGQSERLAKENVVTEITFNGHLGESEAYVDFLLLLAAGSRGGSGCLHSTANSQLL